MRYKSEPSQHPMVSNFSVTLSFKLLIDEVFYKKCKEKGFNLKPKTLTLMINLFNCNLNSWYLDIYHLFVYKLQFGRTLLDKLHLVCDWLSGWPGGYSRVRSSWGCWVPVTFARHTGWAPHGDCWSNAGTSGNVW